MKIVLYSQQFRGNTQPVRHLLGHLGLKFEQVFKKGHQINDLVRAEQLFGANQSLLICDGTAINHPIAMGKHLCRLAKQQSLLGSSPKDLMRVQNFLCLFTDLMTDVQQKFYQHSESRAQDQSTEFKIKEVIENLNQRNYLLGYPTICDFFMAQLFEWQLSYYKFVNTTAQTYVKRVKQLSKSYHDRPNSVKRPLVQGLDI